MSEHVWCQENIAAYVAGGLDVTEGERLEEHLGDCGDCARGVEEARALDRKLAPLFRAANPGPALEDRLIRALPSRQARRLRLSLTLSRRAKACLAVAAAFLLMALGAAVSEFSDDEKINVLVAKENLDTGLIMKRPEDLFEMKQKLKADVPPKAITDLKELKGRMLKIPRRIGEMITANELIDKESAGVSANLPEGYRAVGQKVNMESISGGCASLPSSRVDVIHTARGSDGKPISQVLLENVLVLSADQQSVRDDSGKAMPAHVVTLSLLPEDVLKLELARNSGSISMALRKYGDTYRGGNIKTTEEQALASTYYSRDKRKGDDALKSADELAREMREETVALLKDAKKSDVKNLESTPSLMFGPGVNTNSGVMGSVALSGRSFGNADSSAGENKYTRGGQFELKEFDEGKSLAKVHDPSAPPKKAVQDAEMNQKQAEAKTEQMDRLKSLLARDGQLLEEAEKIVRDQKQIQGQTDRNKDNPAAKKDMQEALGKSTPPPPSATEFGNKLAPLNQSSSLAGTGQVFGGSFPGTTSGMGMMGGMPPTMGGMGNMNGRRMPGGDGPPSDPLAGEGRSGGSQRIQFAPVFVSPKMEWAVPSNPKQSGDSKPAEAKDLASNNANKGILPDIYSSFKGSLPNIQDQFIPRDDKTRNESDKEKLQQLAKLVPSAPAPSSASPAFPAPFDGAPLPAVPAPPPAKVADAKPEPKSDSLGGDLVQKPNQEKPKEPANQDPLLKPKVFDPPQAQPAPAPRRVIIRTGELEFEIDSFDLSVATIMKLINATKGGFIATINSEKLPNGKVRGSVVIRIPPEHLDGFVLDLRKDLGKVGELKNQRIGSQDITKQYTDLESRLRAARTMEDRLLNIIKDGKGQIKDLLLAEKELGVWRTQIEEIEGELRYYGNLASLSTLTIKLHEKNIGSAAIITESERVQAGLEVEDVEKVRKEALKAIEEVKGRVTRDELKQHSAGQFNAILNFEVSPEATGPTRDRLKQLGNMVRLQIDRLQSTEDGSPPAKNGKIERGNTQFQLSIYNLANITPRESNVLRLAVSDVPGTYQKLREVVGKAKGHVVNAQLNEQDKQKINAQLDFNVRRATEADILTALAGTGETLSRQVIRLPEGDNVTDSKVAFSIALVDADFIQPRETVVMRIVAADVKAAYEKLREALGKTKTKTRVLTDLLNDQDKRNITAQLDFTYSRADEGDLQKALDKAGETLSRQVTRLAESNNVTDAKVLARVELIAADTIQPRETLNIRIAADDLRGAFQKLRMDVLAAKARVINAQVNEQDRQNMTAQIDFIYVRHDVGFWLNVFPRADEAVIHAALTGAGETLARLVTRLPESPAVTDAKVLVRVELLPTDALMLRESISLTIAASNVPVTYETLRSLVAKVKGKVLVANINKEDRGNVTAQLAFTFPRGDDNVIQTALGTAGETLTRKVDRVLEPGNYTDTKMLAIVKLEQADSLAARETVKVTIAAVNVPAAYQSLRTAIGKAKGRITNAKLNEQDRSNITAHLSFDVPRTEEAALQTLLVNLGETLTRQANREQDTIKVTDTKIGFDLDLSPDTAVPPRETTALGLVDVTDPAAVMAGFQAMVEKAQGRVFEPQINQEADGKLTASATFDVPFKLSSSLLENFKAAGKVRVLKVIPHPQAPDGKLALGRIVVVVAGVAPIVPSDQGATAELRRGLSMGVWGFSKMLNWLIVGVSFVLPLLVIVPIVWLGRRFLGPTKRSPVTEAMPAK